MTETQQKFEHATETKGHYEKLRKAYRSDRVELREQKDLIQKIQVELEKVNERVSILSVKCQERSTENKKLKAEHVDAIKEKDYQLETAEKDKANLLCAQQWQLSEVGSSQERVDQVFTEQIAKLEKSFTASIEKKRSLIRQVDDLRPENLSMEEQIEEVNHFGPTIFNVPPYFMHHILNWMEEHPESILKRRADETQLRQEERSKAVKETAKKGKKRQP